MNEKDYFEFGARWHQALLGGTITTKEGAQVIRGQEVFEDQGNLIITKPKIVAPPRNFNLGMLMRAEVKLFVNGYEVASGHVANAEREDRGIYDDSFSGRNYMVGRRDELRVTAIFQNPFNDFRNRSEDGREFQIQRMRADQARMRFEHDRMERESRQRMMNIPEMGFIDLGRSDGIGFSEITFNEVKTNGKGKTKDKTKKRK